MKSQSGSAGVTDATWQELARLSTPEVCNAIETFRLRTRNEGYISTGLSRRVLLPEALVGYALTLRAKTATPPPSGLSYINRTDWWDQLTSLPHPKIIVIQDIDEEPGLGAVGGEVHAGIFKAFGAVGIVTNGAIRDLPALQRMGMQAFSASLSPSHAYAHIVDIGHPVKIAGLEIATGDILHGDQHGLTLVPQEIAGQIPQASAHIREQEHRILALCAAPDFSATRLRALLSEIESSQAP